MATIRVLAATLVLIGVLAPGFGGAEELPPESLALLARPALRALRVETAPTLDGDVLGDPAWEGVPAANGFRQTTPDEGQFSSQTTDVYVAYTADTLYFGVVCHDTNPQGIIVADSRRDSSLVETDSIQIILDTYLDQQTGYVFGTNPVGIEYDGQVTREGEGGFGSAGGFNRNWDGVWEVEAKITEDGWSTEIAIPFTTIRFPRGSQEQTWGMNVQRNIRRRNETAFWSPLPRQFDLYRLSLAGTLNGLEVPKQRNLKIAPYVLGNWQREGVEEAETDSNGEFGVDLKYSITPSMTLDATYNTDFAQVEVDELQINLDRFNLFFPEKRPFFLENAGYFDVGVPEEVELFFSRRIGIGPDGEIIPIAGGVRLSGKAAERYNVGALYMRTEEALGVGPQNDFGVARVSRDLPNRSSIGGLFISREGRGRQALEPERLDSGFCRPDRQPRCGGGRVRFQPERPLRLGEVVVFNRLHRGRRRLQSRSRVFAAERLPQARHLSDAPDPARKSLGPPRVAATCFLPRLLGLRWLPGDRLSARRQPLGVAQRLRGPHRCQLYSRGADRAVRDLPGGHRSHGYL
jgi:hypothetical protein